MRKFGFFVDKATGFVQVPSWSFLSKLVLGYVIFECKRHYSYGDDSGDDENLVASPFSILSKNCSDDSPYVVPVHVAVVTNVFGSDFGPLKIVRAPVSFKKYVTRYLALCALLKY